LGECGEDATPYIPPVGFFTAPSVAIMGVGTPLAGSEGGTNAE
jgi:hypothetical protein